MTGVVTQRIFENWERPTSWPSPSWSTIRFTDVPVAIICGEAGDGIWSSWIDVTNNSHLSEIWQWLSLHNRYHIDLSQLLISNQEWIIKKSLKSYTSVFLKQKTITQSIWPPFLVYSSTFMFHLKRGQVDLINSRC